MRELKLPTEPELRRPKTSKDWLLVYNKKVELEAEAKRLFTARSFKTEIVDALIYKSKETERLISELHEWLMSNLRLVIHTIPRG